MEYKAIESVLQTINPHTGEVLHIIIYIFYVSAFNSSVTRIKNVWREFKQLHAILCYNLKIN